jgi:hypothetical protein
MVVEERIGPGGQWLESVVSTPDPAAVGELLEALGLGELVSIEPGRLVFGTDDVDGVRAALRQMERAQ